MQLAHRETQRRASEHSDSGPCPACSRGKNGRVECRVTTGKQLFRCPRCRREAQLFPDDDSRNCTCGALMRKKLMPPVRATPRPRHGDPDRVPMPPAWRCQACGGLHWHVMALVKVCPLAEKP